MKHKLLNKIITAVAVILLLGGAGLLLYPTVSDWWNAHQQKSVVISYQHAVEEMDTAEIDRIRAEAQAYNRTLLDMPGRFTMTEEQLEEYRKQLDITGKGVMGSIEIPKIKVNLPIYHGTDEAVLQTSIGHIEGSSLPVGGKGTHTVLSGHRGLPSARLFTDIDQLEEGDIWFLHVLNDTLTYEADQIVTVLPSQMDDLAIDPGGDYCTLITCTPYGINTHRLLVRGHRIPTPVMEEETEESSEVNAPEEKVFSLKWIGPVILVILLAAVYIIWIRSKKRGR